MVEVFSRAVELVATPLDDRLEAAAFDLPVPLSDAVLPLDPVALLDRDLDLVRAVDGDLLRHAR